MAKIGLGIITCNRSEFFKNCYNSVPRDKVDELVIVNDGDEFPFVFKGNAHYIKNDKNLGVGISKNKAFKFLLESGCDYIFLIEDDIIIINENVFTEYIKYIEKTGIQHLMFGYHGPANKREGVPKPRVIIDYGDDISMALNFHCVGAFCVYTKELLNNIGLFDEKFLNAWEHIDHSYQAIKSGYLPGYWWWPDIHNSYEYLDEQACSENNSTIRPRGDWQKNIHEGMKHFVSKHKYTPVEVPNITENEVITKLKQIRKNA